MRGSWMLAAFVDLDSVQTLLSFFVTRGPLQATTRGKYEFKQSLRSSLNGVAVGHYRPRWMKQFRRQLRPIPTRAILCLQLIELHGPLPTPFHHNGDAGGDEIATTPKISTDSALACGAWHRFALFIEVRGQRACTYDSSQPRISAVSPWCSRS